MTNISSRIRSAGATLRVHGPGALAEILANFLLPFIIYDLTNDSIGSGPALMGSSVPPILWSIAGFVRDRRIDAISIVVLAGIALSLLAFAGGGDVRFLQLRENLVTGLVGLGFLGSAAIGKPIFYQLMRAGLRRRSPDKVAIFEVLCEDPEFRRAMVLATVAWGGSLMGACALNCMFVFAVSIKTFLLISPPISYSALGLMLAWTFWYVPRAYHAAEARYRSQAPDVRK